MLEVDTPNQSIGHFHCADQNSIPTNHCKRNLCVACRTQPRLAHLTPASKAHYGYGNSWGINMDKTFSRNACYANRSTHELLLVLCEKAGELDKTELKRWIKQELHGYSSSPVPHYRRVQGSVEESLLPKLIHSIRLTRPINNNSRSILISQSVEVLEAHVVNRTDMEFRFESGTSVSESATNRSYRFYRETILVEYSSLNYILESVRNQTLKYLSIL